MSRDENTNTRIIARTLFLILKIRAGPIYAGGGWRENSFPRAFRTSDCINVEICNDIASSDVLRIDKGS